MRRNQEGIDAGRRMRCPQDQHEEAGKPHPQGACLGPATKRVERHKAGNTCAGMADDN
jgi:hypothetical protein